MMKIPKRVSVAGLKIRVLREDLSDEGTWGYFSADRMVIALAEGMEEDRLWKTLRHEILEASLTLSGVGYCEGYEQESVCRCLDQIFFPAWETVLRKAGATITLEQHHTDS